MAQTARKFKPANSSLLERERAATSWSGNVPVRGYTLLPHSFWADLPRLSRGGTQGFLILRAWRLTAGLERAKGSPAPEWSPWTLWSEFSEFLHCSIREAKDDARDATARGIVAIEEQHAKVRIRLLWRDWGKLPDYEPGRPVLVPAPEKAQMELDLVPLSKEPTLIRAGESSAPIRVTMPVKELCYTSVDAGGFQCSGTVDRAGRMTLQFRLADCGDKKAKGGRINDVDVVKRKSTSTSFTNHSPIVPSAEPAAIPDILLESFAGFGTVSDRALLKLISDCEIAANGCKIEEIAAVVREIGEPAARSRSVQNLIAVILAAVPRHFASAAYRAAQKRKPVARARPQSVLEYFAEESEESK